MKKTIVILCLLFFAAVCFGDVFTSHLKPKTDSTLTIGTDSLRWLYGYYDTLESTVLTDGTFTVSKGTISVGTWNATTVTVSYGGTGATSLTDGGILLGSGTGAITVLGVATNGQIPIGDGTTDPVLATITGTTNQISVTNAAGSITLSTPQDIHTGASPTFAGLALTADYEVDTSTTPAWELDGNGDSMPVTGSFNDADFDLDTNDDLMPAHFAYFVPDTSGDLMPTGG